ncbi:MAG: lysine--tRNA ligase [Deltaproteobacteria bacterium]|nr:lysine--tRNA ligase [Deltaproteobacteria bacterium]
MTKENIYRQQRLETAAKLRELNINPYSNQHTPQNLAADLHEKFKSTTREELEPMTEVYSLAGRVIAIRNFGKAGFMKIRDRSGEFQIFQQQGLMGGDESDTVRKQVEVGDFVYAEGPVFRTKTNELSIRTQQLRMVTKAIEQLPEKYHGLTDIEARYRRRYVDMIANPEVKEVFKKRSLVNSFIRRYFEALDFLEVETPMMHPIPGGATARPFVTHHNTLDMDLYLRIAPELYLKRLLVGGIERVFEINRNFRNEGISTQHNPEFTMLEFYMSYATYEDLITLTEDLISKLAVAICGSDVITYQGQTISFKKPFERLTLFEAIKKYVGCSDADLSDRGFLLSECDKRNIPLNSHKAENTTRADTMQKLMPKRVEKTFQGFKDRERCDIGVIQLLLFEECVEKQLLSPTFITHYPSAVSPLSRRNEQDPMLVDRFELFISGREIANAFSELNDPVDQRQRFLKQVAEREAGDDEAMYCDDDYIMALEYGMPPAAGEGIGIDRLVMILTDSASIRDVILFPVLRKEG